jgi:hypothetical protein
MEWSSGCVTAERGCRRERTKALDAGMSGLTKRKCSAQAGIIIIGSSDFIA